MNILMVLAGDTTLDLNLIKEKYNIEYIVAVDGGYNLLESNKIKPNIIIGDLDSIKKHNINIETIQLNPQKDDTDFAWALNYLNKEYNNSQIYVSGFLSFNRIEHFVANLKLIQENIIFLEKNTTVELFLPGDHQIDYFTGYISFFAHSEVDNLTLVNFKYPLQKYKLKINDTLCISNELTDTVGKISFTSGKLIVFKSEK